ncbi:membrane protein [Clostridium gelidum]|uniref:Membrane protein n=1 Tax=Clostridium gelidum TaxID=704125 RepID=A0ABM7T6S8_9CLOT|nr:HsmA family protein [Clostridium gelidum]BCZ46987.1 membrane protein [Clostridium gelidum]
MLRYAIISITSSLLFYTIGVWSGKKQGELKNWHLFVFYLGLAFDILGTVFMSKLTKGGFQFNFHGLIGLLSIILMLLNVVFATIILIRNDKKLKSIFHKFSITVWFIWLISFISGAFLSMSH